MTSDVRRIDVEEARRAVESGRALLVCAYEDEAKCRSIRLEGSLTLSQLQARLPAFPKDQELIFYCA